jgi:Na+/H+-dicarboxylate symporter
MFRHSMAARDEVREGYHIEHPNREKASAKATKAAVILLLLVSVGLMVIVTIGGWSRLAGQQPMQIGFILVYLILAFYAGRWSRGVLPLAAALAMILGIFAGISAPQWLARDLPGYSSPALPESLIGLITMIIVPVQVLLIAFAMRGFQQAWNVEVEVPDGDQGRPGADDEAGGAPAAA